MIKTLPPLTPDTLADHMVEVPSGSFDMGTEDIGDEERPIHKVCLDTFEICRYPAPKPSGKR